MPKTADPVTPFFDMVRMAISGDPVMLRNLATTLGAFSVRLCVALLNLVATLWLARRLGRAAEQALGKVPHHQHR